MKNTEIFLGYTDKVLPSKRDVALKIITFERDNYKKLQEARQKELVIKERED